MQIDIRPPGPKEVLRLRCRPSRDSRLPTARVIRAVPNYQAWVGFSDSRARLPYPRFVAGYEF